MSERASPPSLMKTLTRRQRRIFGFIESLLVLRKHTGVADLADVRDPSDGNVFHDEDLEADEEPIRRGDREDDPAVDVDDGDVVRAIRNLEEKAGEQVREEWRDCAARNANEHTKEDEGLVWDSREDVAHEAEERDRKSTRLNSSHSGESRMPSSA